MKEQHNKTFRMVEQENLCLQTKILIDRLRSNLLLIEDFDSHKYYKWNSRLKVLKNDINDIYWNI